MDDPQFCPFCGSPIAYAPHEHEPRHAQLAELARAQGDEPPPLPPRVRDLLSGEAFVGVCQGCRSISHIVGHRSAG